MSRVGRRRYQEGEVVPSHVPSSRPIYLHIADDLRADIITGQFVPGDRLPSENELAERYGVQNLTVRKGLHVLVREGLIVSRPKRGYFVREGGQIMDETARGLDDMAVLSDAGFTRTGFEDEWLPRSPTEAEADRMELPPIPVVELVRRVFFDPGGRCLMVRRSVYATGGRRF